MQILAAQLCSSLQSDLAIMRGSYHLESFAKMPIGYLSVTSTVICFGGVYVESFCLIKNVPDVAKKE